jgi:predicted PurR-regulated permease PerM
MNFKEQYQKYSLIAIIICIGLFVILQLSPFLSGLLGAMVIYIMLRKPMNYLAEKNIKPGLAAIILLVGFILCVLVPLSLTIWMSISKIASINFDAQAIIGYIKHVTNLLEEKTGYNILSAENLSSLATALSKVGQSLMNGISSFFVNIFVMIFVLYFMLIGRKQMEAYIYDLLPFNETNKKEILNEIHVLVKANAIGIPLQAIIQGLLATLGYYIFDTPAPFIFGILTCFATVVPIVGTALIWVPLVGYLALIGNWTYTIGLTIYAVLILAQMDNLIRFILQKKMANTHPLTTFFGVFTGLSLFGFMGIIFGPLLLSMLLLCVNIIKKEYLKS